MPKFEPAYRLVRYGLAEKSKRLPDNKENKRRTETRRFSVLKEELKRELPEETPTKGYSLYITI